MWRRRAGSVATCVLVLLLFASSAVVSGNTTKLSTEKQGDDDVAQDVGSTAEVCDSNDSSEKSEPRALAEADSEEEEDQGDDEDQDDYNDGDAEEPVVEPGGNEGSEVEIQEDEDGVDEWDEERLGPCADQDDECGDWAAVGECDNNAGYMLRNCAKSCEICTLTPDECFDDDDSCEEWASVGECEKNPTYMASSCQKSCKTCFSRVSDFGLKQSHEGLEAEQTAQIIRESFRYMKKMVNDPLYRRVRRGCYNRESRCSFWAGLGECNENPGYMSLKCGPACQSCELLDPTVRCPLDPNAPDAVGPGDLHKMFERIASAPEGSDIASYGPVVQSRPAGADEVHELIAQRQVENVIEGSWVMTFDKFLSEEECDRLIEFAKNKGYTRSQDVGDEQEDGTFDSVTTNHRTSENTWCDEECKEDPIIRPVLERISSVTGFPNENSEDLQLLRYEPGQYYKEHHDFIEYQVDRPVGPRILTFFLYLNNVTAGGGTRFSQLGENGLTVQPVKGKALLWPSTIDEDPNERDDSTFHEALPVEEGLKFGANAWLHLRDFKTSLDDNCA